MSVTIPDDILQASRMNEEEMKREIAVFLFREERLTLAQASSFVGMSRSEFQHLLASRKIPVHYGEEELEEDVETMKELDQ